MVVRPLSSDNMRTVANLREEETVRTRNGSAMLMVTTDVRKKACIKYITIKLRSKSFSKNIGDILLVVTIFKFNVVYPRV